MRDTILAYVLWLTPNILIFTGHNIDAEWMLNIGRFLLWAAVIITALGGIALYMQGKLDEFILARANRGIIRSTMSWAIMIGTVIHAIVWGYFVVATVLTITIVIMESYAYEVRNG